MLVRIVGKLVVGEFSKQVDKFLTSNVAWIHPGSKYGMQTNYPVRKRGNQMELITMTMVQFVLVRYDQKVKSLFSFGVHSLGSLYMISKFGSERRALAYNTLWDCLADKPQIGVFNK